MKKYESEMVFNPIGSPFRKDSNLLDLLEHKHRIFGKIALKDSDLLNLIEKLDNLENLGNDDLVDLYRCQI